MLSKGSVEAPLVSQPLLLAFLWKKLFDIFITNPEYLQGKRKKAI